MTTLTIEPVTGPALEPLLPQLAALRVTVFRAFPYLYDGDVAYETDYLRTYLASPRAAVIVARQAGAVIGASTCLPLSDETANVQAPFLARGWDPARFFYFGESVLLPQYRGQGIGVAFFAGREAHARAVSDCETACFCAVGRPADHPARPADYEPLDRFWQRRGYARQEGLACEMAWRDIGEAAETTKTLTFWMKSLRDAPQP